MTSVADQEWFHNAGLHTVLRLLNDNGGEARIVGGAVRNGLMGIAVSDMDIATTLLPEEVQRRAEAASIKCVPTGLKHGTVTLVIDGQPFEVTTLRKDLETDGRHAEVEFTDDWRADAERRDLTINALYADQQGEVHDYVGGLADIGSKTIRFIGEAALRIEEDHLRILRFFRFFAYYGHGRPDAEGIKASAAAKGKLRSLSSERVWSEIKKLLAAPDPFRALLWMRTASVLTTVLPETEKWGIDLMPALVEAERKFGWAPDPLLRLAAIVPPDAERLNAMADRLKLAGAERDYLASWASVPLPADDLSNTALDRFLYQHGAAGTIVRLKLAIVSAAAKSEGSTAELARTGRLVSMLAHAEAWEKPVMPVKGGDLLDMGFTPGPEVGAALARLEETWVESGFSLAREALLARLKH